MDYCESVRTTKTAYSVRCHKIEGHEGPCSFADGNGCHIWFDGYEIANLREVLRTIDDAENKSPLKVFNQGDYFAQIRNKLDQVYLPNNKPNKDSIQLLNEFDIRNV